MAFEATYLLYMAVLFINVQKECKVKFADESVMGTRRISVHSDFNGINFEVGKCFRLWNSHTLKKAQ